MLPDQTPWDAKVDIVVIGSGAAGLTGAIIATRNGLSTAVFEKAPRWGGTTALSGGAVWAPANSLQRRAGITDSVQAATAYLDEVVGDCGAATSPARRRAYLEHAPQMVDVLMEEGIKWRVDRQPDYLATPNAAVSRDLDPKLFNLGRLGAWRNSMRYTPMPFAITLNEIPSVGRAFSGLASACTMVRIMLRHLATRALGREMVGCGASLVAQLMAAALRRSVAVHLNAPLREVIVEDGRATGVVVEQNGQCRRIRAQVGLLLAGGGFAHAADLRTKLQGVDGSLSSASPDDTGDLLRLADELGAMTALLDQAWWATTFLFPGNVPYFFQWERALPHCLVVDPGGHRFADESGDYDSFAKAMIAHQIETAWLIMDARHRHKYTFGAMRPGHTPQRMFDEGFFVRGDTLQELAAKCEIDARTLDGTVRRFNSFADAGVDPDFGRGAKPYDRHWGDPTIKPNPNLARIERAPFLAAKIRIGDLGTRGGFVTDDVGRVLRADGVPIEGLYASGNCTAAVVGRAYPGPGVTLGPAMTFAYIAMQHAARAR